MVITKQDVFNTAAAIAARGDKPTLNEVRKALGSGSFSTISDAMTEWRTIQKAAVVAISAASRETAPTSISSRLNELADDVWELALQMAHERLQSEREELERASCELKQARQEAVELADAVQADLELAQNIIKQQTETISHAAMEIESLKQEISPLTAALLMAKHDTQTANAVLTEAHQRVDQLTIMLDDEKAERINASKKLEQSLLTIAELNANVTELAADLNVMSNRAKAAEVKSNQTDQALNDATKKIDKSVSEIQALQNKATLAEAQMVSFRAQVSEFKNEAKAAIEEAAELRGKLSAAQERISVLEGLN